MKKYNKKFKIAIVVFIASYLLSVAGYANAQTAPEFLVSWRAINYVPADYQGKILPSKSSRVEVGFDLIDKNKIADLSKSAVSWFLDENRITYGAGLKTANFNVNSGLNQTVRITVSGYAQNDLDYVFLLPVVNPEVVIDTKTPTKTLRNQNWLPFKNYDFEARPFFFNISDTSMLQFKWRINNDLVEGAPENTALLKLNLQSEGAPKETQMTISAGASNTLNQLEFASKIMNFIVK